MSLAAIPLDVKHRLLKLHGRNRIGWRARALETYMLCGFLNSLENTVRALIQQGQKRKVPKAKMPSFEKLFGLPEAARSFDDFTDWIDGLEDSDVADA